MSCYQPAPMTLPSSRVLALAALLLGIGYSRCEQPRFATICSALMVDATSLNTHWLYGAAKADIAVCPSGRATVTAHSVKKRRPATPRAASNDARRASRRVALVHESKLDSEPSRPEASHRPTAYESGRPISVIAFRTLHASSASASCRSGVRARRRFPMIDLYRKKAFSTRAC
jgi:hypothetical protein